jgi:HlyD family secretion protein
MKKVILLLSVLAVIAVGWFLYFDKGEVSTIVGIHEVAYGDLENTLEFSGEVKCTNMYSVMSETGGTVSKFYVSEGTQVEAGDRLFDLDSSAVEAQLKEAQLKYDALSDASTQTVMAQQTGGKSLAEQQKAAVALALSQTTGYDLDSFNEALGSGAGEAAAAAAATIGDKLSDLTSLQNAAQTGDITSLDADSQLKMAELAVEQLQDTLDKMHYSSRISGTVLAVNVNKGEVLAPGVPALVIADTDSTDISGYVYEKDVDGLTTGMDVTIISEDHKYQGKLTQIGKAAADIGESSTFDTMTKVTITPNASFKKMPGAVVDLKIVLSSKKGVLTIPADCLTDDGCVFVVGAEDIVEKRQVTTGFEDMFNVEVLQGLGEGELVVTTPGSVKEGQHVSYDRG